MKLEKLQRNLEEKREILKSLNNEINSKKNERAKVQKEIAQIHAAIKIQSQNSKIGIEISDHALVRYIERVLGIQIDNLKSDILNIEVERCIKIMNGNGTFRINNIEYRVKDNIITTIINH